MTTDAHTATSVRALLKRYRSLPFMAVLSLFLLFAQVVEQGHSHEAGPQAQFDCEICLKVGSLDDLLVADVTPFEFTAASQRYTLLVQDPSSTESIRATARAPPANS